MKNTLITMLIAYEKLGIQTFKNVTSHLHTDFVIAYADWGSRSSDHLSFYAAKSVYLAGRDSNVTAKAVVEVLFDFFEDAEVSFPELPQDSIEDDLCYQIKARL